MSRRVIPSTFCCGQSCLAKMSWRGRKTHSSGRTSSQAQVRTSGCIGAFSMIWPLAESTCPTTPLCNFARKLEVLKMGAKSKWAPAAGLFLKFYKLLNSDWKIRNLQMGAKTKWVQKQNGTLRGAYFLLKHLNYLLRKLGISGSQPEMRLGVA